MHCRFITRIVRIEILFILVLSIRHGTSSTIGHVVIFSPPLFGHLVPILDLARHLAQHHHVTFVSSVSVLSELRARKIIMDDLDVAGIDGLRIEFIGLNDNKSLSLGRVGKTMRINTI